MSLLVTSNDAFGGFHAQVVIALSGGELIYFELSATGQLLEVEKHDLAGDVVSLDIAPVPEGRQRSRFLAVASYDSKVWLLWMSNNSLAPSTGWLDAMQVA